jgi:hypothetical protein
MTLPQADKLLAELPEQTMTILSGARINRGMGPLIPFASPRRQFKRLTGRDEVFINSTHSAAGRPMEGEGSAMISLITISYRSWQKPVAGPKPSNNIGIHDFTRQYYMRNDRETKGKNRKFSVKKTFKQCCIKCKLYERLFMFQ